MTVQIYDGMNVMRRAYERKGYMPGEVPMSMRMRYEKTCAAAPGSQIWIWDGAQHNERRQAIYPRYKTNREPAGEDVYSQIRLWKEVLRYSHAVQITVHGWEADDVIGTLVRQIAARGGPKPEVFSNDMDYGQVAHLCTLKGVNMKGVPCNRIALYKALVGDSSDFIAGVPGFGPGRWLEMEPHWDAIQRAIAAGHPEGFIDLPFKPKVKAWLADPENIKTLQAMLTVTHFMNVPDDELTGGITKGNLDFTKGHACLSEFFL
jgi:5'-3' exonuclease